MRNVKRDTLEENRCRTAKLKSISYENEEVRSDDGEKSNSGVGLSEEDSKSIRREGLKVKEKYRVLLPPSICHGQRTQRGGASSIGLYQEPWDHIEFILKWSSMERYNMISIEGGFSSIYSYYRTETTNRPRLVKKEKKYSPLAYLGSVYTWVLVCSKAMSQGTNL